MFFTGHYSLRRRVTRHELRRAGLAGRPRLCPTIQQRAIPHSFKAGGISAVRRRGLTQGRRGRCDRMHRWQLFDRLLRELLCERLDNAMRDDFARQSTSHAVLRRV